MGVLQIFLSCFHIAYLFIRLCFKSASWAMFGYKFEVRISLRRRFGLSKFAQVTWALQPCSGHSKRCLEVKAPQKNLSASSAVMSLPNSRLYACSSLIKSPPWLRLPLFKHHLHLKISLHINKLILLKEGCWTTYSAFLFCLEKNDSLFISDVIFRDWITKHVAFWIHVL